MAIAQPEVTIFIRARNEARYIEQCLAVLVEQRYDRPFEVLLLDSESSDGTVAHARSYPVSIISIPKRLFSYSASLNYGARRARGSILISLSAHAIPCNEMWLTNLLRPLEEDPNCGASFSRQISWPECCGREIQAQERVFPVTDFRLDAEELSRRIKAGQLPSAAATFSNTASAFRRELVLQNGFRTLPFAEDRMFALELLQHGLHIAYASSSLVYHAHEPVARDFMQVAERASRARAAIDGWYYTQVLRRKAPWELPRFLRALVTAPLAVSILPMLAALRSCFGPEDDFREARFLLASIGTSVGKLLGSYRAVFGRRRTPEVANCSALEAAAITIQQCGAVSQRDRSAATASHEVM